MQNERREQIMSKGALFLVAGVFGSQRWQDMCKFDGAGIEWVEQVMLARRWSWLKRFNMRPNLVERVPP